MLRERVKDKESNLAPVDVEEPMVIKIGFIMMEADNEEDHDGDGIVENGTDTDECKFLDHVDLLESNEEKVGEDDDHIDEDAD